MRVLLVCLAAVCVAQICAAASLKAYDVDNSPYIMTPAMAAAMQNMPVDQQPLTNSVLDPLGDLFNMNQPTAAVRRDLNSIAYFPANDPRIVGGEPEAPRFLETQATQGPITRTYTAYNDRQGMATTLTEVDRHGQGGLSAQLPPGSSSAALPTNALQSQAVMSSMQAAQNSMAMQQSSLGIAPPAADAPRPVPRHSHSAGSHSAPAPPPGSSVQEQAVPAEENGVKGKKHIVTTTTTMIHRRRVPSATVPTDDEAEEIEMERKAEQKVRLKKQLKELDGGDDDDDDDDGDDDDEGHHGGSGGRGGGRKHHGKGHHGKGRHGKHHGRRHHRRHGSSASASASSTEVPPAPSMSSSGITSSDAASSLSSSSEGSASASSSSASSQSSSASGSTCKKKPPSEQNSEHSDGKVKVHVTISKEDECEPEDPVLAAKRAKLAALEQSLAEKQKQWNEESNWLTQAETLIHTLHGKAKNVRLHLNDIHKDMSQLHFAEKEVTKEVQKLQEKATLAHSLSQLQKELAELSGNNDSVMSKIKELSAKRAETMGRMEEVRNVLTQIRAKHSQMNQQPADTVVVAQSVSSACPCHLPVKYRLNCISECN